MVYDFAETRAGANARTFLEGWQGKLVCDDYSGYKAGFNKGITEIGCSAKLNGHDPYAYLKDVMQRLPTQRASAIGELPPHNWVAADKV